MQIAFPTLPSVALSLSCQRVARYYVALRKMNLLYLILEAGYVVSKVNFMHTFRRHCTERRRG